MKKLFLLLMAVISIGLCASAQTRTITGVVVGTVDDEPLVGATVVPVGGGEGTSADLDGKFTLKIGPNVREVRVSMVGYVTKTVPVANRMTIQLESSEKMLNEVAVVGYKTTQVGKVTGQVATVGAQVFEDTPTANFVDALQGQVAGLTVFSGSGDPSANANSIRLRGVNSINADNSPLFILDGSPITETVFTTLNPNDIEQISVLKDAASIAIYGSRAANGVIVITSKRGRYEQAPTFSLRASVGWSQMTPDKVHMMNSKEFMQYRELIGKPLSEEVQTLINDYGIDTDWVSEVFDGHAPTYSIEASMTGGSDRSSYYLSFNHMDQQGIIGQSGMRREVLRASLRSRITDWLTIGHQSNLGFTKYQMNSQISSEKIYTSNPMVFARQAYPYDAPYYYTIGEDGQMIKGGKALYLRYTDLFNPEYYQSIQNISRNRVSYNGSIFEQINPVAGLTIRAQQSVDAYDYRLHNNWQPVEGVAVPWTNALQYYTSPNAQGIQEGMTQESFSRYYSFTYTNTAQYNRVFNDVHDFSVLVGQESIISKSEGFGASSSGQVDPRMTMLTQGTEVTMSNLSQSIAQEVFNSYFFNLSYNYDSRYFLDASLRRDGSSRFAPGHRWGTFWALGAMWNAKKEAFLQDVNWLDDARVRVSYGTTGNASVGNYAYFGLVGASSNYGNQTSLGVAQQSNYDLTWETVKAFDFGLSARMFNRLDAEIGVYRKETCDMLLDIPYSYTTGFSAGSGNIGSMKNVGVDVMVKGDIFKTQDWYIGARCNFNYNHNEITALFDGNDTFTLPQAGLQYKVGHNAGEYYMVPFAGIDPADGAPMWYDINGNITKIYNDERDSRLVGKSIYSPWSGGWGFDIRWKGLTLRTDWAWAAGKYMINNDRYFLENNNFAESNNQMNTMLNVWTHPGQVTDIPAPGYTIQFDTHLLEDASFMRLKNLTLQYTLPEVWTRKAQMKQVTLHFTGRNLLTFTGFTGYDPEPEVNVVKFSYPNTRQYEFGVEVTF